MREWAGIHTDITERRLTEQALRDGERRFRELADAMPQIVWGARADGFVDYYNRRWYEFTGRPEGGAGDDTWGAVHPDDQAEAVRVWHAAIQSGDSCEIESRLKRSDGEYRWYVTRAVPVRDGAGKITRWLGTCTDIDARVRSEEDLRGLAAMLAKSNRELEDFASVASHDLQEPLRKIQSFAERMRDEAGRRPRRRRARLPQSHPERGDADAYARRRPPGVLPVLVEGEALLPGRPQRGGGRGGLGSRSATGRRREGSWRWGRCRSSSAIASRCASSCRTSSGTRSSSIARETAPLVRVSAELIDGAPDANGRTLPGGTVRLRVADNGIGFDEKYLDRVFKIFQRLHGRGEYDGSGIGLAICRKIVERHGGTITAQSKPGEGATFIVTLPLVQKAQGGAHVD